jgi:hypothetical protein
MRWRSSTVPAVAAAQYRRSISHRAARLAAEPPRLGAAALASRSCAGARSRTPSLSSTVAVTEGRHRRADDVLEWRGGFWRFRPGRRSPGLGSPLGTKGGPRHRCKRLGTGYNTAATAAASAYAVGCTGVGVTGQVMSYCRYISDRDKLDSQPSPPPPRPCAWSYLCKVLYQLASTLLRLGQIKPVYGLGETQVGVNTGNDNACIYR